MGLGIVCSILVLVLLVGLGYYVKRAQDRKLEQLSHSIAEIEAKLARLEQGTDHLETPLGEEPLSKDKASCCSGYSNLDTENE